VQNGEKRFDKRKTQLMQHEYFVFHVLNLCPPDDIMVNALLDYQRLLMQIAAFPIPNKNLIVNLNIAISLLPQLTPLKVKGLAQKKLPPLQGELLNVK